MSKRFDISTSEIISSWETLGSMNAVARSLGCSVAMVKSRLEKEGITCSHSDGASRRYAVEAEQQWKDIYADAYSGMSFPDLVKKYRMTRERLRSLFEKHGFDYEARLAEIKSEAHAGYGETLRQMRESGMSVKEMAENLGKSVTTVSRDLLSFGLTKSAARSDISDDEVVADFNSGLTIVEIARKHCCSHDTITKRLKSHGIACSRAEGINRHFKREQTKIWPFIESDIAAGKNVTFIGEKYNMGTRTVHALAAAHGYALKPGVKCDFLSEKLLSLVNDSHSDYYRTGCPGEYASLILDYYNEHGTVPSVNELADIRGVRASTVRGIIKKYHLSSFVNITNESYMVSRLVGVLDDLGVVYERNNRYLLCSSENKRPLEIDLYLPDYKLGIEANPSYTHSIDFNSVRVDKMYHQKKSLLAESLGIGLVHVYDDDVMDQRRWSILVEQIKSRVVDRTHVGARKCEVRRVANSEANAFLNRFHFQGSVGGHFDGYGLYLDGQLISLLCMGVSRYTSHDYEIVRYCVDPSYVVSGGFQKLLSAFTDTLDGDADIVSYMDLNKRFSAENLYERSGFVLEGITNPDYAWYDSAGRHMLSRYMTTKTKLAAQGYDRSRTEVEIMTERGFGRVFKAGSKRYVYHFKFAGKD